MSTVSERCSTPAIIVAGRGPKSVMAIVSPRHEDFGAASVRANLGCTVSGATERG